MFSYLNMNGGEAAAEQRAVARLYEQSRAAGLKLNMSRGIPDKTQVDLSQGMLELLKTPEDYMADGTDTRSYAAPMCAGLPCAKAFFAPFLGVPEDNVIVGGNSSLNLMHDAVARGMVFGFSGCEPWAAQSLRGKIKFICPAPGYDRHFAVTEHFGIEMVTVPMGRHGPDMDAVEELVKDPAVKGIWCVPKYSNPTGVTYSKETVERFASLRPAADDFRIFWDNAYCVHDLYGTSDELANLYELLARDGREEMAFIFVSTAKISFPGAGVAAMAAGAQGAARIKKAVSVQTIGFDKTNQLRHVRFLKDMENVHAHMKKHAAVIRPKFEAVLNELDAQLTPAEIASWTKPRGGYFISLDVLPGTAKRVVELCAAAGVQMTPAGATFPYGIDPEDKNIRIAPTFPSVSEIEQAAELLCLCVRLAALEKITGVKAL